MVATFTYDDFARHAGDVYGPYKAYLTALTDDELTAEEDKQRAGWWDCAGEHDRQTNPRYGLYVDAWEAVQWEWDRRNQRRAMFAAIALGGTR
jgi:hypothetical protein